MFPRELTFFLFAILSVNSSSWLSSCR